MDNKEKPDETLSDDEKHQRWLLLYPEMERWAEANRDLVDWMTEAMKFPPRSDCG